ncbi:hypothetical protein C7974DRAFT_182122 [Boeremia exigua]|uniref:uncharacterized protein n=1 Tax=Boeremia exigua TaxID=749465 RepID=UPI001E8DAD3B|nr:uncharacterized protein C7974DRAFT_182122 [Boeremia exigua]KAH6629153.1 hypothetical protein C7974DRAFT_182122 [Boeremia exigua]
MAQAYPCSPTLTQLEFWAWTTDREREIEWSKGAPQIIGTSNSDQQVPCLTLTYPLASAITRALYLGREHTAHEAHERNWKAKLETRRTKTTAKSKSVVFGIAMKELEIEKNGKSTTEQTRELEHLFRAQARNDIEISFIKETEDGFRRVHEQSLERRTAAWLRVDSILKHVWWDAGLQRQEKGGTQRDLGVSSESRNEANLKST